MSTVQRRTWSSASLRCLIWALASLTFSTGCSNTDLQQEKRARWQNYLSDMRSSGNSNQDNGKTNRANKALRQELSSLTVAEIPILAHLLAEEPEVSNRQIILLELGESRLNAAVDFLVNYLSENFSVLKGTVEQEWEEQFVIEALGRAQSQYAFDQLATILKEGPPRQQASSLRSIAGMPQLRQLDALYIDLLSSASMRVRTRAAIALGVPNQSGEFPALEFLSPIEDFFLQEQEISPLLALATCLGNLRQDSSIPLLENAMSRVQGMKSQLVLVKAIAAVGSRQAGESLREILKSDLSPRLSYFVKEAALRLLNDD